MHKEGLANSFCPAGPKTVALNPGTLCASNPSFLKAHGTIAVENYGNHIDFIS